MIKIFKGNLLLLFYSFLEEKLDLLLTGKALFILLVWKLKIIIQMKELWMLKHRIKELGMTV